MNQKILDAFNEHLNSELYSSLLYLSMSASFESQNLKGMAHWMRKQAEEEHLHAMKFFDFINERGGTVRIGNVKEPRAEWSSPLKVFEHSYSHEREISELIDNLENIALSEKDHASHSFLQWFVTEQVEEEATALEIRDKLKLVGDNTVALFMIDQEMSKRTAGVVE